MRSRRQLRHTFNFVLLVNAILVDCLRGASGGSLPPPLVPFSPEAIAEVMRKTNDYQMHHPVMKGANRNWERGTWFTGVMAAYQATGEEAYRGQARRFGEEHQWQPGTEKPGGNVLTCTQTYLELYQLESNRAMIEPTIQWLNSPRPNTPAGGAIWYFGGGRRYADSLYVGPPALALLAKITGEEKYRDWMNQFFWDVHAELFDPQEALFYRDRRFIGQTTVHGKKVLWSRGNGWAFASLPRILDQLPLDAPARPKFVALFGAMAASLVKRQGPDGLWRPNLADMEEFPMRESSGTGFFCYGLAWGIRTALLDRETYLPSVRQAWAGLVDCLSDEGKVRWGQWVGDRPVAITEDSSHEYVTGTFLLAGSEVLKLVKAGVLADSGMSESDHAKPRSQPVAP